MKTIIAGGRDVTDPEELLKAIRSCPWEITSIVVGGARGADELGKQYAINNKIEMHTYYADWGEYGNAAGPIRNDMMAKMSQALIALWDGESKGTKHMIQSATKKGLAVHVHMVGNKTLL